MRSRSLLGRVPVPVRLVEQPVKRLYSALSGNTKSCGRRSRHRVRRGSGPDPGAAARRHPHPRNDPRGRLGVPPLVTREVETGEVGRGKGTRTARPTRGESCGGPAGLNPSLPSGVVARSSAPSDNGREQAKDPAGGDVHPDRVPVPRDAHRCAGPPGAKFLGPWGPQARLPAQRPARQAVDNVTSLVCPPSPATRASRIDGPGDATTVRER